MKTSSGQLALIWLLAAVLVALNFQLQADIGLNMADEGYLWYGAWRVSEGEVPRLDFRGYDPPRNYWLAFFAPFFGDGILGMRAGADLFLAIGLALGLLAARRAAPTLLLVPLALLLLVWVFPRHKVFEHAIAMAAVYVAVLMLENPGTRSAFLGGFFVGLAGTFRRNHAVYTCVAMTGVLIHNEILKPGRLTWHSFRAFLTFAAGVVTGFFPVWILTIRHPGFGNAYLDSILVILRRGQSNQPLPIPWPWTLDFAGLESWVLAHRLGVGIGFTLLFVFFPMAAFRLWQTRDNVSPARTLLLAATLVGLPYTHHAMVRSDVAHLCQVAHPVLLGTLALLATFQGARRQAYRGTVAFLLIALTAAVPLFVQPRVLKARHAKAFVADDLNGDSMWIWKSQAKLIQHSRDLVESGGEDDFVFIAPMSTALYPILGKTSPTWDPYPLWAPSEEGSQRMIEDLRHPRVRWAIIDHTAVSGDHFWDTHPDVWDYINDSFTKIESRKLDVLRVSFFERNSSVP